MQYRILIRLIEVTFIKALSAGSYLFTINKNIVNSTQQIKFEGIDSPIRFINSTTNETYYNITEDGIYDIEFVTDANTIISTNYTTNQELNLKVQFLSYYPDQLCYDGKMYAIAYGMPILTDYTIIADRTWFKDKINSWSYFADKKKAFTFERTSNGKSFNAMSFAAETVIELQKDGVSYQTKASYNGNAINYHSDQADNDDRLVIGSTKDSLGNQCFIGCHSDILIFNRTLTEYELSWVKNNMMCSKQ